MLDILNNPEQIVRFKPHLRPVPVDDVGVFLLGECERYLLEGRLYRRVCPLIDGVRTVRELIDALAGEVSPPEVLYTLELLARRGYLCPVDPVPGGPQAAFWQALGIAPASAGANLAAHPITVETLGSVDATPLIESLRDSGVRVQSPGSLRVLLVDDYLAPVLEQVNHDALERGQSWMPVKPDGLLSWIGPVFRSGEGPCWACLAQRVRHNRPVEAFIQNRSGRRIAPPLAASAATRRAALELTAASLTRWLALGGGILDGSLLTLDHRSFSIETHRVVRRPQCPVCGDPELLRRRGFAPVTLETRPAAHTDDGGYRCVTPEDTYQRYRHHISPLTGVVSSLGPLPGRDHPLRPVYGAGFFSIPVGERPRFDEFQQSSLGKGRSVAQARASALGEALERYSAVFQGDEPRRHERYADLAGAAVHPAALLRYSDAQYRDRERWNRRDQTVPLRFDERAAIDWTPAWSLTRQCPRYLPTAYCYARADVPGRQFCRYDSNGHAAGNGLEEAVLQGFLELVERDAAALWWYNRVARPAVDLASFEEPYFTELQRHYRDLGWTLRVCDLTTDLRIPAFVALAHDAADGRFCPGLGCHWEARLGVQRALTELNQLFDPRQPSRLPWSDSRADFGYLFPDRSHSARRPEDFAPPPTGDLRSMVEACVQRAAERDLEVLVLDQTRPDIGLSVVKVVVPGLHHCWPRFAPGRLYQVPVQLGWLARSLRETELNPEPLWI